MRSPETYGGRMRYLRRLSVATLLLAVVTLLPSVAMAKPRIQVDVTEYFADTITEGDKEVITHTFKIRNVGDEVLTIKKVRPG